MRSGVLAAALLALPFSAAAQDIAGPEAIWTADGLAECTVRPWVDAFGDCLASLGASEAAVAFAQALEADAGVAMPGVLTGFTERGAVDAGRVLFPAMANSNDQVLFLNGTPPILSPQALAIGDPADRAAAALRTAHSEAMLAGPPELAGYRDLPDGGQRFVLTDRLTEGCRACAVLATAVTFVDFRDGALAAVTPVAWAGPEAALAPAAARRAMEAGEVAPLQYRLLLNGHDAGPPDGITGPRTRMALEEFLAANCLPSLVEEPEFRPASIAVLAGTAPSACGG